MKIELEKGTVLTLEFIFNREADMHYWCFTKGPVIPMSNITYYVTKEKIALFVVSEDIMGDRCTPETLFKGVVETKEGCNKKEIVELLDSVYSHENGGKTPGGYINPNDSTIIIFESKYIRKLSQKEVDERTL